MCIYQSKEDMNEPFGKKIGQDVDRNRKQFWKEVCKVNGGKLESCNRIKDGNGRLALGDHAVERIWKEYFRDLYDIHTQEQVIVHMYGFDGIQRGNYFGGEPIRRTKVQEGGKA